MMEKKIPLRIFVAGPYCPRGVSEHDASRIAQRNVDIAIEIGNKIIDRGHYAFVPHLTHYMHIHYSCKKDRNIWYYEFDNTFLDIWANALFYIAPSYGAERELERAMLLKYQIFYSIEEIAIIKK